MRTTSVAIRKARSADVGAQEGRAGAEAVGRIRVDMPLEEEGGIDKRMLMMRAKNDVEYKYD